MHKIIRLLAVKLLFLFVVFTSFVSPEKISASELIGTHLGEGDVGFQINIIRNILIPNGLEPGSPVTVMVPVTMAQPSQIDTVKELANAVSSGGYFPIVRINGVCADFESETGLNSVQVIQEIRNVFGPDALILWGNEINNRENECDNWGKYASDYNKIKGLSNVSPAALDYYMGNPEYTVTKMFADTSGMESLFNKPTRAANAYGCVGSSATDCDPLGTTTQQIGYQAITGPVYLTEFSLSPEGNSTTAPDTDIKKVLEFIENRAGETGAQKVTPLVRNVCNSESDWLLYVNGKLFTPQGTEVSENCEGTSRGSGGYDLDMYPEYGADSTKFYLAPIRNVINGPSTQRTVEKLRSELSLQGYQAYCASENVKISPKYNTKGLINRFFEIYPDGYVEKEVDSIETLNFTNAQYPLWRDVSNKQFLLSSLEEYFGFRDVYETHPADSVVSSSPINSLLSEPQLCLQGWKNLVAQQLACERLERPAECELLTRSIPDTSFTVATLIGELSKFEPNYREGTAKTGCSELIYGDNNTFINNNVDEVGRAKLLKGLINTPTYFDRAYRYGFVVAAIHTKDPGTSGGNVATKIFNFFTKPTRNAVPTDEVLVAAFKLPDIGTNKGGGDDSGSQFWADSLDLTRQVLYTREQNLKHENEERDASRREILQNAARESIQDETSDIWCYEGTFPNGTGTTSCKNPLTKALTDIVNGNAQGCGDTEPVNIIRDLAGLDNPTETYGKEFNIDNGQKVLENLFGGDLTHKAGTFFDPQVAETKDPADELKSLFTISKNRNPVTWPPEVSSTTVDFYIVYPMGFELEVIEEAMKGAFFTKAQLAELEQSPEKIDGFEMTGQSMGLAGGSTGWSYIDLEKTAAGKCGTTEVIDPITGEPTGEKVNKVCEEEVKITIKQEGSGVGILGGSLGYWMRKVQQQLSSRSTQAWEYFESCKTTEEFMLGKCSGGNFSNSGENSGDGSETLPGENIEAVAQCSGGARIGSGGEADHIDVVGTGACEDQEPTREYNTKVHGIPNWKDPNDPVVSCDFLYSYVACGEYSKSLIQNPVNSSGKFVSNGNTTACEYVVQTAKENGISPRFALAIWGEESGFSHYRVPDFGVISKPAQDLGEQVTTFARTANSHSGYLSFLEAYSGEERGENDPSPAQFCNNPNFVARLKTFYDYLGPR